VRVPTADPDEPAAPLWPDADPAALADRHQIVALLGLLPPRQRQVMALTFDGYTPTVASGTSFGAEAVLRALDLPVDVIGTSDGWGVGKPSAAFFDRVVVEAGCSAGQVLYVGDRLDNDIYPAKAAGLATALVRRGPRGHILDDDTIADRCLFRLDSLAELPELVRKHNEGG
jgi:FMN phosphatase YigB (HAD superfamily)